MKTDDLIAAIAADNSFARQRAGRRRITLAAMLLASMVAAALVFFVLMGVRHDWAASGTAGAVLGKEVLALTATGTGLLLAWERSRPDGRSSSFWLLPPLVLAGLVTWEMAVLGKEGWGSRLIGATGPICLATIPAIALLPLVALLMILKERAPAYPTLAGAAAGFGAAGFGAAVYATHCTEDSMLFVMLWYGLAAVLLTAAGALAGRYWLRW